MQTVTAQFFEDVQDPLLLQRCPFESLLGCCRLLLASLPHLPALRELHIFSTGVLDRRSLSLVASLSCTHCKLKEVSLAFSPDKSFVPADLGVLER